jgi:hypothetical protein
VGESLSLSVAFKASIFYSFAKERLLPRMDEVIEELATKWLRELDQRLCWPRYRQNQDDFCYGQGFGEFENCLPFGDHGGCLDYECCKAEYEAE